MNYTRSDACRPNSDGQGGRGGRGERGFVDPWLQVEALIIPWWLFSPELGCGSLDCDNDGFIDSAGFPPQRSQDMCSTPPSLGFE